MIAASLEIQLLANMAQLTRDMELVKSQVGGAMSHVERAAAVAKGALVGLGAVGLAAAFAGNIRAAIDLADSLNKLTQRTGLSVESLSQLQYAAKMADVSNESLSTSLKKLNINIAAGAAGDKEKVAMFKALGITVTDTAGRIKTADVVLMEIADTFAKSKDGAGKTAAAVAALGKAGDEMIPLLNGGSESIKAMMAEADKLGLTIGTDFAAAAEEFNDNLTRVQASSQKLTIALAGDLVSGLGKAMKAMADATIEGGKLAGVIAGIQMLLTGDDLHKANVATVKGTELVMAAEAALDKARASGDAKRIERLTAAVALRKQELATDLNYRKMLEADQAKDEAAAAALKKLRTGGAEIKVPGGAAAAAQMSEFDKIAKKIQEQIDLDTASLAVGRELTESEKFRSKVLSEMAAAKEKLTAVERARIEVMLNEKAASDLLKDIQKSEFDQAKSIAAERQRLRNADYESVQKHLEGERETDNARNKSMRDTLTGMADETAALTMTNGQREIAIKLREIEKTGIDKNSVAYLEYAENIRAAVLKKEAIDDATKQQVGMWQSIDGAARDTFVSIFDSGKSAFDRLRDTLKNGLYALLYEITVKKWLISIGASVSGAGVAQQAFGATSGAGGLAGSGSSISNLLGSGISSAITGGLSAGFGGLTGTIGSLFGAAGTGATLGGSISAGTIALGAGNIAGGLATLAGALGPIALGVAGLFSLFGGDEGPKSKGTGNAAVGFDALGNRTSTSYQDGAGGSSAAVESTLAAISKGYLDAAKGLGLAARDSFFAVGGHGTEGEQDHKFRISGGTNTTKAYFDSEVQAATPEAMQLAASRAVFAALAGSDLPRQLAGLFDGQDFNTVTQAGIDAVLKKGQALQEFDAALAAMPLAQLAGLSYTAAAGLIAAAGGIEHIGELANAAASWVNNYTTAEERRTQTIQAINSKIGDLGFDANTANRESLRALYEAQDRNTEAGQRAIVAILGVGDAFASITPELGTLATVAGEAAVSVSDAMKRLMDVRASQAVELLRAQGNTAGADAAQYSLDTAGLGVAERSVFDQNVRDRQQIDALNAATTSVAEAAAAALAAQQAETQRLAAVATQRAQFDIQIMQLQGNAAGALAAQRAIELAAMDATLVPMQNVIYGLQDVAAATAAQQAETQRMAAVATQRAQLEIQIMQLQGNAAGALAAQRAIELASLDATLRPLKLVAYGLQDVAAAATAAAAAAQAAGSAYFAGIDRNANAASLTDQGQSALDKLYGTTTAAAGEAAVSSANESLAAAKAAAQTWLGVGDSLRSTLESIRAQTVQLGSNTYENLWAQFKTLNTLTRGSDLASAGKLTGAANAFLTASEENSASMIDYLRDRGRIDSALSETLKYVDSTTSAQDLLANNSAAAVTQLTAMNANLTGYAAQVYELLSKGYSGADRTTAAGVSAQYGSASADFGNYFSTTAAGSTRDFAGGTLTRLGGDMAQFTGADGRIDYIRAGESLLDVGKRIAAIREQWERQYSIDLPAFAGGGNHAGGLRVVGERGWEVEATGPSRIWNQSQMASALRGSGGSNDDVVAELRETRAMLKDVLQELEEIKGSNRLMAGIQDKWDGEGIPPVREEAEVS